MIWNSKRKMSNWYLQTKHCLHRYEQGRYIKCLKEYLGFQTVKLRISVKNWDSVIHQIESLRQQSNWKPLCIHNFRFSPPPINLKYNCTCFIPISFLNTYMIVLLLTSAAFSLFLRGLRGASVSKTGCYQQTKNTKWAKVSCQKNEFNKTVK